MFDNIERYLKFKDNLPKFNNIHKNEKIYFYSKL